MNTLINWNNSLRVILASLFCSRAWLKDDPLTHMSHSRLYSFSFQKGRDSAAKAKDHTFCPEQEAGPKWGNPSNGPKYSQRDICADKTRTILHSSWNTGQKNLTSRSSFQLTSPFLPIFPIRHKCQTHFPRDRCGANGSWQAKGCRGHNVLSQSNYC